MRSYGKNIKKIRESLGVAAADLANRLGWSRSKMSAIETGANRLLLDDAAAIADALGVELVELVSGYWGGGSVGERIRSLRRDRGWTQEELARRLGILRTQVPGWENNKRKPSALNMLRLSKVFEVTVDFLESGDRGEYKLETIPSASLESLVEALRVADKKHPGMAEGFLLLLEEGLLCTLQDAQDISDLVRIMRRRASDE